MIRWRLATRIFLLGILVTNASNAQWAVGPVFGVGFGSNPNVSAALGYAGPVAREKGTSLGEWGFSLGTGIELGGFHHLIPQIGFWWEAGLAVGCKVAAYTSSGETTLAVVPEIGFGLLGLRLVWGFPFIAAGPEMKTISSSQFGIYFFYPVSPKNWR